MGATQVREVKIIRSITLDKSSSNERTWKKNRLRSKNSK